MGAIAIIQTAEGIATIAIADAKALIEWLRANTDAADTAQLQKLDAGYAKAIAEEQAKSAGGA